jgi:hypothetical protein
VTDPAPYLTPHEVKQGVRGGALADEDDGALVALIAEFEEIAERYLGTAFRLRTVTDEFVRIGPRLVLAHYLPTDITITDADDVELTPTANPSGVVDWGTAGYGTCRAGTAAYTHGYADPPAVVLWACWEYVWACVVQARGSQPETAQSYSVDNYTYRQTKPNWQALEPTGFRTVDRLLNSSPISVRIPGVA